MDAGLNERAMPRPRHPSCRCTVVPVMEYSKPSLETDGRTVLSWDAPGIVWRPLDRFVVSSWSRP